MHMCHNMQAKKILWIYAVIVIQVPLRMYHISLAIRQNFSLPKQSQKSRSISCFIATFLKTDLVICSHSREGKTLSHSQINMVIIFWVPSDRKHLAYCLNYMKSMFELNIGASRVFIVWESIWIFFSK